MACRDRAASGGVLASTSSSLPMRSPVAARRRSAGASDSHRSRMVGKVADISTRSPSRTATTDGPATSGRHTRPASAACALSSGSTGCNASRNAVMRVLPNPGPAPYTMLNHEPRRQAHAAVRLVARSGHRDVPRHPHRRGVAREAVARAIPGAAQARHRARRHQPAERGEAARQVHLRRLRAGPVCVGHQVRERHRLAELLSAAGGRRSAPPRTAASS